MKVKFGLFLFVCLALAPMMHADDVTIAAGSTVTTVNWYNSFNFSCQNGCSGAFPTPAYFQNPFSVSIPGVTVQGTILSATLTLSGINTNSYDTCGINSCNHVSNSGLFTSVDGVALNTGNATIDLLNPAFASALASIASGNSTLIQGYTDTNVGSAYNYGVSYSNTYSIPYYGRNCDSYGCYTYVAGYNYYTTYYYNGSNSGSNTSDVSATLTIDSTPEPAGLVLLGSGLVGTLGAGKKLLGKFRG